MSPWSAPERASRNALRASSLVCACTEGFVYVGHRVVGDDGEEVEIKDAVPALRRPLGMSAMCAQQRSPLPF